MSSNRSYTILLAGITGISMYAVFKLLQYLRPADNSPPSTPRPFETKDFEPSSSTDNNLEVIPIRSQFEMNETKISHDQTLRFFTPPLASPTQSLISEMPSELKNPPPFIHVAAVPALPIATNNINAEIKNVSTAPAVITEIKTSPSESKSSHVTTMAVDETIKDDKLLEFILCPITGEIMTDPVTTTKGQTYERKAIEEWFRRGKSTDPITNEVLIDKKLTDNFSIKSIICQYRKNQLYFIPIENKMTKTQLINEINKINTILIPLQNYANKSGLRAFTKHHQPEAKKLLIELRAEFDILKSCREDNKNTQLNKIIALIENNKTKNKKSGFTMALQKVILEIQKFYPVTEPPRIRRSL